MNFQTRQTGLEVIQAPTKVEASLWRRLRFENDVSCRDEIFQSHQEYARKIAKSQFHKRPAYGLEIEDFDQLAYAGLLQAIDRFDPTLGVPFKAYARHRIIGSIADGALNSSEKATQYSHVQRAHTERGQSLLGDDIEASDDAIGRLTHLVIGLAIGFILEDADVQSFDNIKDKQPNAYESLAWREMQSLLIKNVDTLPPNEHIVVKRHYFDGIAFKHIAFLLKVTSGRVSQLHKSAIKRLRTRLRPF